MTPIPLLIVSREMAPAKGKETLLTLVLASQILNRPIHPFFGYGQGHAVYMNELVKSAFATLQKTKVKMLYIEDDILIPSSQAHQIALSITEADTKDWNMTTNYKLMDGRNVIHHKDGTSYTDTEIDRLKFGDKIDLAGMGFYYGDFWTDYRFHEGDYSSIDWTFFKDKEVELHYSPILCQHVKMGWI